MEMKDGHYRVSAEELFSQVELLLDTLKGTPTLKENAMMHQTLVLCCHEGIRDTEQAFGNLFSQVDYLCKRHHVAVADKIAIQEARRHSNQQEPLSADDLRYDLRALCVFIAAVFQTSIPGKIAARLPINNRPFEAKRPERYRIIRCIVQSWDEQHIVVTPHIPLSSDPATPELTDRLVIDYTAPHLTHLGELLREGLQMNIIDARMNEERVLEPSLVVVEPDFLLDISSIAACFKEYGSHELNYTVARLQPRANSQATLLGNFASSALDAIINQQESYEMGATLRRNFKEKALEYCTCEDFDAARFKFDATMQTRNMQAVVAILQKEFDREKMILEPSFVCEQLGIQGRVDLMTTDFRLLVEQKSGRNMNIERGMGVHRQLEPHYVQLLLYYGVLHENFLLANNHADIRLLYSKYPPQQGLMVVAFYQKLFREAIECRNRIAARELKIAREGFGATLSELAPETLNTKQMDNFFYCRYLLPAIEKVTRPLQNLSPLEHAYFCQMMTFVYREQALAKLGVEEGVGNSMADLWNMPLNEKLETGNIYLGLTITRKEKSSKENGFDLITLEVPEQDYDFLPNFRYGDMVYLYTYPTGKAPDARHSILYRGSLVEISTQTLVVALQNAQQNPHILVPREGLYAIEHGGSDAATNAAVRGLHELMTAPQHRKDLLLGQRSPEQEDAPAVLSRAYHADYDPVLKQAKRAKDYFLLIGPPGTGKTSMALRFLVEEELTRERASLLLTAYTNRAVDEICSMLESAHLDYLRLGNQYSCDPRFRSHLLEKALDDSPQLSAIRQRITTTRIIVGTTSMLQVRPFIFNIKHFSLAIIDEASQILEPNIVGLLAAHHNDQCCIDRFILVGDYKQLPAVVQQSEKETKINDPLLLQAGITDCRMSLFERLIAAERTKKRSSFVGVLHKQGRMHPDIADFPNRMFYNEEQLQPVPLPHQNDQSIAHRVVFIPSKFCRQAGLSDKVNTDEARIVCRQLARIYRENRNDFRPQKTVGVIVPYRNQIAVIRKELEQLHIPALKDISIDTVERYQGSQRDYIIYSFTIQNTYQLEFLTSNCFELNGRIIDRKLNVAMTRARKQLILTGNEQILRRNALFQNLMNYIKEKGGWENEVLGTENVE